MQQAALLLMALNFSSSKKKPDFIKKDELPAETQGGPTHWHSFFSTKG